MRHLILVSVLCLSFLGTARAANLISLVITNGSINFPCNGAAPWTPIVPVHGAVVSAYLFAIKTHVPNVGADVMLGDPNLGDYPVAQLHQFYTNASGGDSAESHEEFGIHSMWMDQLGVIASCNGGGYIELFATVRIDPSIPHP